MAYVYRYIDLEAEEVVYVGKVTSSDIGTQESLRKRHEQHKREDWYKQNAKSIVMQYIELETHTDADILETWLINFYDTGQLVNRAKTGWGKCSFDMFPLCFGNWRTYGRGWQGAEQEVSMAANVLLKSTESLRYNVDSALEYFCERVRAIRSEIVKADRWSRYDEQDIFLRSGKRMKREEKHEPAAEIIAEWNKTHQAGAGFQAKDGIRVDGKPMILFFKPGDVREWSVQYCGTGRYFETEEEARIWMAELAKQPVNDSNAGEGGE